MKSPGLCYGNERRMVPREQKFSATKPQQLATPLGKSLVLLLRVTPGVRPSLGHTMGVHQSREGPLFAPKLLILSTNPAQHQSIPSSWVGEIFFIHGQTPLLQLPQTPGRSQSANAHTHTYTHLFFYEIELNFPLDCGEK